MEILKASKGRVMNTLAVEASMVKNISDWTISQKV